MIKRFLPFILFIGVSFSIFSQEKWTLQKCIEYGLSNNPTIKINSLSLRTTQITEKYQKYNYLPTIDASASHGYNFGQRIDPFTNQFATTSVRTNNFYLSSRLNLFSGLENYYGQKKSRTEVSSQQFNLEIEKRNFKINITASYLQTLVGYQNYQISLEQLKLTNNQLDRIKVLVKEKHLIASDQLELEAQLALDSLLSIKAKNEYNYSLFTLKQFLNLNNSDTFEIELNPPVITKAPSFSPFLIETFPDVLIYDKKIELSTYELKLSKAKYYPSLSLSGSLGSGYSGNSSQLVNGELLPKPFETQLRENFYQSVSLSLSIPILSSGNTRRDIALSKIEVDKNQVEKEKAMFEFKGKIEQLNIDIINAQAEKNASEKAFQSISKIMEITTLKYEEGEINFSTFLEVRNKLFKVKTELQNSKINLLFKQKTLRYYL